MNVCVYLSYEQPILCVNLSYEQSILCVYLSCLCLYVHGHNIEILSNTHGNIQPYCHYREHAVGRIYIHTFFKDAVWLIFLLHAAIVLNANRSLLLRVCVFIATSLLE